ncbi:23S rRNA (uracil(747)-C(5))-methyltransferase RlmC [Paenibacillus sp. TRM 82003]|uniref:23S rRNA (uracil(747)-C(5))-methyltransferase RlmC n=1 Tax=Kineococcus sp. TRM81007 TaxID=2925831 RepID=UPI001F560AC6|nr:23S rRNA (uracil(747)-C(5))-methyltransferase RlmC [Kineococcus sp. TRM81007]MCI2238513.1 23S rRNA (uracil(747)-C(5))-methyltransferase RlmC [Kineococcus sp. TRM81007]MCI3921974.1 23S rRNA (uracil(747)-C(5))-methyltransferase RlmC [Paenibacillus sp. TRM 82003]
MQCSYLDAGACRSCTLMGVPYPRQVAGKEERCRELLGEQPQLQWLPAVRSAESGYRNKAKMVVGGTARRPTLGILDAAGRGVDLRRCGVCTPGVRAALPVLARFISRAGLEPYDVPRRRGELKNVLVTESPDGELMVRFVVRSRGPVAAMRRELPRLLRELPNAVVVTANLLPEHKAVVEGDMEVPLTERTALRMRLGGVGMDLRPQSFFQTNSAVAEALYAQVAEWVDEVAPATLWDLYCGVGGFALRCAAPGRRVLGVEVSEEAVRSARASARTAGLRDVRFLAGDATRFALEADEAPDLVVVNPPRRGIGADLREWLERSGARHVVYSSCNPVTLAADLAAMPSLRPVRARVLDMFPQTSHVEVVTLLERAG